MPEGLNATHGALAHDYHDYFEAAERIHTRVEYPSLQTRARPDPPIRSCQVIPRQARSTLLALTIGLAVACTTPPATAAQQPAARPDLAAITNHLEREAEKILCETGIPAISMALVQDGSVAWAGTFGYANVGASVPATSETYFSTGSTFKFVTATAIMQLVEKGELELDTPLNEIAGPGLAIDGANDVTVRHLLSHHSGLQGPVGTVPLWSRINVRTPTVRGPELWAGHRHIGAERRR